MEQWHHAHYEHSGPEGYYDKKMCQNSRHHQQKAQGDGGSKLSPHGSWGYGPGFGKRVRWRAPPQRRLTACGLFVEFGDLLSTGLREDGRCEMMGGCLFSLVERTPPADVEEAWVCWRECAEDDGERERVLWCVFVCLSIYCSIFLASRLSVYYAQVRVYSMHNIMIARWYSHDSAVAQQSWLVIPT